MAGFFSREGASKFAKDFADHLDLTANIKALQQGQKDLADALVKLGDRIRAVETDMQVLKVETKYEALKEAQGLINAVQGGPNERIQDLAVKIERHDASLQMRPVPSTPPAPLSV